MVDCSRILSSAAPGVYAPLAFLELFAKVQLEHGVPTWPNGAALDPAWSHTELANSGTWPVPI